MLLSVIFSSILLAVSGCQRTPPQLRALPDFSLTGVTVDGVSPLDRRALRGRVWIADFVYTRCSGPCPLLTAHMASLQKRVPRSVGLLSFSVDPDHDSPEVLTLYAKKFKADPQRWFFVTGDKPELVRLFRDGFQVAVAESADAPPGQTVAHTTKFVLIDGEGLIRGYYDGDELESLDRLAKDAGGL